MACALGGCSGSSGSNGGGSSTVQFTDSCGRTVEIPAKPTKVAPSGVIAQQVLLTFDAKVVCGVASGLTDAEQKYFGVKGSDFPTFGAIYGTKGSFSKEEVAAAGTELIIDIGEAKSGIVEDLDRLQADIGIPVIHIEATLSTFDEVFTTLGDVLGNKDRAKELASYCATATKDAKASAEKIGADKVSVAYLTDETHALSKGSFQAQVIDMFADNVVVVENGSKTGQGSETSLEQLAVWNPDVLLVQNAESYQAICSDPAWQALDAVAKGACYLVPSTPYCWVNQPPSVNQILGVQWLPALLYPEQSGIDAKGVVQGYFKTLYGYQLSDAEYAELTEFSTSKAA